MHNNPKNIFSQEASELLSVKKNFADLRKESRPPSSTPKLRRKKNQVNNSELEGKIQELLEVYEDLKQKNKQIYTNSIINQEKLIKRENELKKTLNDYEKILMPEKKNQIQDFPKKYQEEIPKIHQKITKKIEYIQKQTLNCLHEQEKIIVRDLNHELNEHYKKIQDLQKVSSRKSVVSKKESLHDEIVSNRARVELIEQRNNFLHKKNKDLKVEYKSYENDVNILYQNLEALKQQNAKLKSQLNMFKEKNLMSKTIDFSDSKAGYSKTERIKTYPSEFKFIESIKRMIELEKKNLRAAKNAYTRELEGKIQLEEIIRQFIDDTKQSSTDKTGKKLEMLQLLYSKTFPVKRGLKKDSYQEIDSDLLIERLDKNIENIERLYSQQEELMQSNTERIAI